MNVPWEGNKCILCFLERELCEEHLIPESLGGKLTCNFLCRPCNSNIGHSFEAKANSDPSILLAVSNLRNHIPILAKTISESHPHLGRSKSGVIEGYFKNNEFKVKSKKLKNNSLIQTTDIARKSIKKILQKSGVEKAKEESAIKKFDASPENVKLEISPGFEVIKWPLQKIELDLSKGKLMNLLIPVKTAFEFLALDIGEVIYNKSPQLQEIRDCLIKQEINDEAVKVERLSSGEYVPMHGIIVERNNPYSIVQVRLFGWLAFKVHFLKIAIEGERFVYTHKLDTGDESVCIVK